MAEIASVTSGITKGRRTSGPTKPVPYLAVSNVQAGHLQMDVVKEIEATPSEIERYALEDGDLVLTEGGDPDKLGRGTVWRRELPLCLHQNHIFRVRLTNGQVFPDYLARYMASSQARSYFLRSAKQTTGIASINMTQLRSMPVAVPQLEEQRRIAGILDHADAIRTKRRQILTHLDTLTQSIFHDMFGDPAINPLGFERRSLGDISWRFSDGPFGSNLKSAHYVPSGVRVIRLQNIGVGSFVDNDAAYVTPEHFAKLAKHRCLPGDVIIGTLGDPNLRACLQPGGIPEALNKADCVQMRVDPAEAARRWACWVLNMPGTLTLAKSMAHGQTRTRIAMGQLRTLKVPVPPLDLQRKFAARVERVESQRIAVEKALAADEEFFASLQSRAFSGML